MSTPTPKEKNQAFSEQPHEQMADYIGQGFGPLVWGEIRRVLPGGGTQTIRKNIQLPITSWSDLGERCAALLTGGGVYIVSLCQNKGERPFVSWKESYEGPPRPAQPGLTLGYNSDTASFELIQQGVEAMGGVPTAQPAGGYNPYAGATPPSPGSPAGILSPPGYPVFPAPQRDQAGRLISPPEALTDPWMRRFPPDQQWSLAREAYSQRHGVALPELSGAQVALQWAGSQGREVEVARTQAARYEERLDATKDRGQALLDAERMARAGLERQVAELKAQHVAAQQQAEAMRRETEFRAKMELLEMKIAQAAQAPQKNNDETIKTIATLAGALAPVAVAYVQTSKQQAAAELQAQQDLQRTMLMAMTQKQSGGLEQIVPLIAALAPMAGPALQQWLANKDPDKIDEAKHNQDQRNLMFMKFMFDMMQAQMGGSEEPEPFWFRFMKELAPQLMGLGKVAMLAAANTANENGKHLPEHRDRGPLPPPSPGQTQVLRPEDSPASVVAPRPTTSYALDVQATVARFAEVDAEAATMLGLILGELSRTPGAEGFLTHEWAAILFHMHAKVDPEELSVLIADHLEHSRTFALLPAGIANIFEAPRTALMGIIPALPVWMLDQEYGQKLVDLTVEEITMREKERIEAAQEVDEETADDEDETEEAAPSSELVVEASVAAAE
jgi:hypothetical protein